MYQHSLDKCERCDSYMDMHQTIHLEEGYDYLQWICTNDECGEIDNRHEYHNIEEREYE